MGSVVGPPVAKQLSSLMGGKVTVQGVDYPADAGVRFPILSYPEPHTDKKCRETQTWAPAAARRWPR